MLIYSQYIPVFRPNLGVSKQAISQQNREGVRIPGTVAGLENDAGWHKSATALTQASSSYIIRNTQHTFDTQTLPCSSFLGTIL